MKLGLGDLRKILDDLCKFFQVILGVNGFLRRQLQFDQTLL